jgi:hypothetical protein
MGKFPQFFTTGTLFKKQGEFSESKEERCPKMGGRNYPTLSLIRFRRSNFSLSPSLYHGIKMHFLK